MSVNKFQPHVFVLPEDDANRQIANGFLLNPKLNNRAIQILPTVGGWSKVIEEFKNVHVPEMRRFSARMVVLLIDFDNDETRLDYVRGQISDELINRVFVIGVLSEPERLKKSTGLSLEDIGEVLALDCSENTNNLWRHELLQHNNNELARLRSSVRPFLFNRE